MANRGKPSPHRPVLRTAFARVGERTFEGYVVDVTELARVFTIELLVDGRTVTSAVANLYAEPLAAEGVGNGCFGFSVSLIHQELSNARVIEARLSNHDQAVGEPIVLDESESTGATIDGPGHARWLGGLRFSGWVGKPSTTAPEIDVIVDGEAVMRVKALGWEHLGHDPEGMRAARSFDFHLPERFADGRVRRLALADDMGNALIAQPLPFFALADGLAAAIATFGDLDAERLRGEIFDQLMPKSIPLARYHDWRDRFPLPPAAQSRLSAAVVLIGTQGVGKTQNSLDEQSHDDWVAAAVNAMDDAAAFDPDEILAFLADDGRDSDVVLFARAGSDFEATALARITAAFDRYPDADLVYGDVDIAAGPQRWPLAFTAFDYERMLEQGFGAHLFAMRRDAAMAALDAGASNLYRLFNTVFDDEAVAPGLRAVHVPGALGTIPPVDPAADAAALQQATASHLQARGVIADVAIGQGGVLPAVRVTRAAGPERTTIVIPTRNRASLLRRCLETIRPAVDRVSAEILVVDNDSNDAETLAYLTEIQDPRTRVLRVPGPFNFARLNNLAAAAVTNDYMCLLNNDIEATDDGWLDELISRMAPDVGAAGALLLWPSGVVQHGGVVLGPSFAAHHAFNDRVDGDPGFGGLLRVAHECSAVTAACLLTRRADYLAVGGMDEARFAVAFNDVDYCLKLRHAGKRIVFTPHARLTHLESASRGTDNRRDREARFQRELQQLRARWGDALINDPCYSPVLSLDPVPFSALAWPPRAMEPRLQTAVAPVETPPGF